MERTRIKTTKKGGLLVAILPIATSDYKAGRNFNSTIMLKNGHSGKIMATVQNEQQANYLMECLK